MEDGFMLSGRTLDLCPDDMPFGVGLVAVPRGSDGALGEPSRYAHAGVIFLPNSSAPRASDYHARIAALNEKGLSCDEQHLNGSKWMSPSGDPNRDLSIHRFCEWAAANFQTVAEVKQALGAVNVIADPESGDANHHYVVRDASGTSVLIEAIDGRLSLYDDLNDHGFTGFGVVTNSPTFDVQLALAKRRWNGTATGAVPGGWHSEARFQRLALVKAALPTPNDMPSAVAQCLAAMDTVSTPAGLQRDTDWVGELTVAGFVRDHRDPTIFWRTYRNQQLQRLRLADLDLRVGSQRVYLSLAEPTGLPWFHDARGALHPT